MKFYAHSIDRKPKSKWQPLEEHLINVAKLSKNFAKDLSAEAWAYNAGLWHDLGKYSKEFQQRLERGGGKRVDHSTAGAIHLKKHPEIQVNQATLLGYVIAGHHCGLMDGASNNESCLKKRLKKEIPNYSWFPPHIDKPCNINSLPFKPKMEKIGFQISFFIRMLFSCIVDADRLDSEKFTNPEKFSWRNLYPSLEALNEKLNLALCEIEKNASLTDINRYRSNILTDCKKAAAKDPGLFTLTVPTGGGKTLSSLAFAFAHALKYGMKRVIYVIPYTSIIEQNANIFRDILGDNSIVEHHSNYDFKKESKREEFSAEELASENWDSPLIVTTNVQFFESLFGSKTSRCRKIHNIANSVVILDEAQMLPVSFLRPCLEALRELSKTYNTTVVFCTATMPAFSKKDEFKHGLDLRKDREISSNPTELYEKFRRVNIKFLSSDEKDSEKLSEISDNTLAENLLNFNQALCIVNTREHARDLFEKVKEHKGAFHLSARMCPAHRTKKIKEIKKALNNKQPCLVISTQIIEGFQ